MNKRNKKWVRIVALVLAAMMVIGAFTALLSTVRFG